MANPNHPPVPTPNRLTPEQQKKQDMRRSYSFLNVDEIEKLRDQQYLLIADKQRHVSPFDKAGMRQAEQDAFAEFGAMRNQYLDTAGIADGDPQRPYFENILQKYSVDGMNEHDWRRGLPDPATGNRESGRDKLEANFDQFINDMVANLPTTPNMINPSPELLQARDELKVLREELAKLSAKRMGRLISRGKTKKEFEKLQQEYHDKLIEVGKKEEELREQNDPNRADDQKRLEVMTHLLENEKDLRGLTNDKLGNTKIARVAAWMNKGGKWAKIAKGVAVAAPIGLITGGAGAVVVAALTGMGLVAASSAGATGAGIAFGFGGRFITNFIRKSADRQIDIKEVNAKASQDALGKIDDIDTKTHEEIQRAATKEHSKELRGDIAEQQKRRRRAAYKAGGIALVGVGIGAAGVGLANAIDRDIMPSFKVRHYGEGGVTSNGSGLEYGENATRFNKASEGKIAGSDMYPRAAGPQPQTEVGGTSGSHASPEAGTGPQTESTTPEGSVASSEYSPEAQTIHADEGLYSVFDQMGVPETDRPALLQKVGPQLATIDQGGKPFAYLINGEQGNWGIRMTPDGKMPAGALDMIQQAHQEMIGAQTPEVTAPSPGTMEVITPREFADNPALDELTNITVEDGRTYVESLGFNPDAWDMVQHQMHDDYPDLFKELGGGRVGINTAALKEGMLPDDVAAELFNRLESIKLPSSDSIIALEKIEASDINDSLLGLFTLVPEFAESTEELLRENGLGHAWLEVNKPEIASEIAKAAPGAFSFENGTLNIIPKGRITSEAWAIIANHMNAVERARVGLGE
ncbi:MAG TPA: hypothetical protein VFZ58_02580 [Candidatus Saccharimonadales bacterium]